MLAVMVVEIMRTSRGNGGVRQFAAGAGADWLPIQRGGLAGYAEPTLLQDRLIDHTQDSVNGTVRLKLYKGNVIVVGRDSKTDSLFDQTIATFDEDGGAYNQADAGGFIKLNALRMRIAANARTKRGQ